MYPTQNHKGEILRALRKFSPPLKGGDFVSLPYSGVWWWAMGYTRIWRDSLKQYLWDLFPAVIKDPRPHCNWGYKHVFPLVWECILKLYPSIFKGGGGGGGGDQKHKIWDGAEKNSFAHLPFLMLFCRGITHAARLFKRGLCGQITSAWPTWNLLTYKIYSMSDVKVVAKPPLAMPMFRCCFVLLPLLYFRNSGSLHFCQVLQLGCFLNVFRDNYSDEK